MILARRTTNNALEGGNLLPLEIHYQSENSSLGDPVLTLFLDPDPNPWNGNEIELSTETINGSGFDDVFIANLMPNLPLEITGNYFLLTRLTKNGRTRYLNLRDPVQITMPEFAQIVPGSLRFESGLFTLTLSGAIGMEAMIQSSHDLTNWATISTFTFTSEQEDFSDPDSDDNLDRFYRIGTITN